MHSCSNAAGPSFFSLNVSASQAVETKLRETNFVEGQPSGCNAKPKLPPQLITLPVHTRTEIANVTPIINLAAVLWANLKHLRVEVQSEVCAVKLGHGTLKKTENLLMSQSSFGS